MSRRKKAEPPVWEELCAAAATLSRMLAAAVEQADRCWQNGEEADSGKLKELTVMLKDVAGVVKALQPEQPTQPEQRPCGVVILPEVELHEEA